MPERIPSLQLILHASSFIAAAILSWWGTSIARKYALARSVLDVPNARSAHAVPVPRGGGLALVFVVLTGVTLGMVVGAVPSRFGTAFLGGGAIVAGLGWLDDRRGLDQWTRIVGHFLAASWAVYWVGGMPSLNIGMSELRLGFLGFLLGVISIVWLINLYNFMDGIDGLAGINALTVGIIGGLL